MRGKPSPASPASADAPSPSAVPSNERRSALLGVEDINSLVQKTTNIRFDRQSDPLSNPNPDQDVSSETAGCADALRSEGKSIYGDDLVEYRGLQFFGVVSSSSQTGEGIQFPEITQTAGFYADDETASQAFDRLARALRSCGDTSGKAAWGRQSPIDFTLSIGQVSESLTYWRFDLRGGAGRDGHYSVEAFVAKNALIQVKGSDLSQKIDLVAEVSNAVRLRLKD